MTNPSAYVNNDALKQLFQDELDKLENDDKLGKSYEVPRQFTIIDEPFSIENGLLTPKLSMKRNDISKRYHELIESMY